MIRRHAAGLRALLMTVDGLSAIGLFVVLSIWRWGSDWAVVWREVIPVPAAFLALYAIGWVAILTMNGLYRPRAHWSLLAEVLDVVRAILAMAVLTLSVLFLFKLPDVSRLFLLALFPAQAIATIATRAGVRWWLVRVRHHGRNTRFVLMLGAGPRGQAFAAKLESHAELGLRVIGFLDDVAPHVPGPWPFLGPLGDLQAALHERIVDEVVICLPFSMWSRIDEITRLCEEEGKIVRIPMDVLEHAISAGRIEELDGTPVFSLVSGPDRELALATKRLVDLVASIVGLIVLSPLLAIIALAIAWKTGRPILFRQQRVGLHGRPFPLVKFRSMTRGAEAQLAELVERNEISGGAFKLTDDPRVTGIGRFLRRTSLDELPQLWNVLRGEMSLVGPRPPLPGEVSGYDIWHRRRLSMKPGITGLWQVRSRREPNFDRWVAADLEYIDRWSLWLDAKILLRTIPAALEGR
jgi:exopolysaccharide biosynthesis polyprenyl glycosylphosphotransferase